MLFLPYFPLIMHDLSEKCGRKQVNKPLIPNNLFHK
jgi:hypothetical protein